MPDRALSPEAFIEHWSMAGANERANSQAFLLGLTQLLGVPQPSPTHEAAGYSFEFPVKIPGGSSTNFLDLYRRGKVKCATRSLCNRVTIPCYTSCWHIPLVQ